MNHASPNLYEFSDERPRERELAVKYTLKTLDFAQRVHAPVVVLHLGSMELKDYTGKLSALLERGGKKTAKYEKLRAEAAAAREARKAKAVERVHATLELDPARSRKTRSQARHRKPAGPRGNSAGRATSSISSASSTVRTWSIGTTSAMRKSRKTSGSSATCSIWSRWPARLAGFHVHDVVFPAVDHAPPGAGTVDFAALKPFVNRSTSRFSNSARPSRRRQSNAALPMSKPSGAMNDFGAVSRRCLIEPL